MLINGTSTDHLKFRVKLHLDSDSGMCYVHQPALEICDKYFSSLKKKSVQDSNNTTVLAVLVKKFGVFYYICYKK